jgi:copper transport protein
LRERIWRTARWAAVLAAAALLLLIPAVAAYQDGAGLPALFGGRAWSEGIRSDTALSAALIGAGLVAGLAVTATGRRRTPTASALGFGSVGLALGALALVGHTRTFGPGWLVPAGDMLHVAAAAIWLGGIIALVLTLSRSSRLKPAEAARTVAGFSAIAAIVVSVLVAAGTVLAWRILNSWSALVSTAYGVALLTKIGLAIAVVALAAYNRFSLVPTITADPDHATDGPAWRRLRTTVRAEAAVLVAIVAATGVLVTQSPVEDRAPAGTDQPALIQEALGTATATIRLTPGTVGVNSLELTIVDADGEPIEPVALPELSVSLAEIGVGPLDRPLSQTAPGRYEAIADFPLAGTWTLHLAVRTTTFDYPTAEFTVEIR